MAKLIFTSRYIRDAPPEHLQNYVRYISKYAQYTLAGLYAKGQGVEKDLEHAFELYRSSAAQGESLCQL